MGWAGQGGTAGRLINRGRLNIIKRLEKDGAENAQEELE